MATYGIDLGTTYSCIAKLDANGNPEVIKNIEDDTSTLASAVYFESETNSIVGDTAKQHVETDGDRVVQFAKRYIGKTGTDKVEWEAFGKIYSPVDISSLILQRLKQMAEDQGEDVKDVVITCPAYFKILERDATKKAGELAGLNVLNLINEPTAAALSYCEHQLQENRTILVYDLGGGTFDVTMLKFEMVTDDEGDEKANVDIVASEGNDRLGGKDWDDALFDYIIDLIADDTGFSKEDIDITTKQAIRDKVEKTKQKLTKKESEKVRVHVNDTTLSQVEVTRKSFEEITSGLVQKTLNYVDAVLQRCPGETIDTVLLVGGSTFMPMIKEAIENKFPGKVQQYEPNLAVAKGALIYSDIIMNELISEGRFGDDGKQQSNNDAGSPSHHVSTRTFNINIADIAPCSFGPGVMCNNDKDYLIDNLIIKDMKMPVVIKETYYTIADNQERIVFNAFENVSKEKRVIPCIDEFGNPQETDPSLEVRLLGELDGIFLKLPPNTPRNSPIEVTFKLDADGLYIKAVNLMNNESIDTTIKMNTDVDMKNSPALHMKVSGEEN